MKHIPRWMLVLLLVAVGAFTTFLFWPGTVTGMMGAYLRSSSSKKAPIFNPYEYTEAVSAIVRSRGFVVAATNIPDRDIPKDIDDVFIPPSYRKQFSPHCTATLYLCIRRDNMLAVYLSFPSASVFDQWRIERTMEAIRRDLRPIQKSIDQKKI